MAFGQKLPGPCRMYEISLLNYLLQTAVEPAHIYLNFSSVRNASIELDRPISFGEGVPGILLFSEFLDTNGQ